MPRSAALLVPLATVGAVAAAALAAASPGSGLAAASSSITKDDNTIITVRGTKCPKSHPHKVGSSSAASWTRIDGGKVVHRVRRSSICAR